WSVLCWSVAEHDALRLSDHSDYDWVLPQSKRRPGRKAKDQQDLFYGFDVCAWNGAHVFAAWRDSREIGRVVWRRVAESNRADSSCRNDGRAFAVDVRGLRVQASRCAKPNGHEQHSVYERSVGRLRDGTDDGHRSRAVYRTVRVGIAGARRHKGERGLRVHAFFCSGAWAWVAVSGARNFFGRAQDASAFGLVDGDRAKGVRPGADWDGPLFPDAVDGRGDKLRVHRFLRCVCHIPVVLGGGPDQTKTVCVGASSSWDWRGGCLGDDGFAKEDRSRNRVAALHRAGARSGAERRPGRHHRYVR